MNSKNSNQPKTQPKPQPKPASEPRPQPNNGQTVSKGQGNKK